MKRNWLLSRRRFVLIPFFLAAAILAGCAAQGLMPRNMAGVSRYFDAGKNTVWDAVMCAAEGIPVEMSDREKGILRTQWMKGWSSTKTTGLLLEGQWQERCRLLIQISEEQGRTYVSISAQVETKAPGGSQAYRWSRMPSDGAAELKFLKKLECLLGEK